MKFVIQTGYEGREASAIALACNATDGWSFRKASTIAEDEIPLGSIEFIEEMLGYSPEPDYYPEFAWPFLFRQVARRDSLISIGCFVKPADRYKRFEAFIHYGGPQGQAISQKHFGPFWLSQIVKFTEEWRYYIAHGKVIMAEWYKGEADQAPGISDYPQAPQLPSGLQIPPGYCGAIDFGTLPDGRLALVEACHPYAVGWYGSQDDSRAYADFIIAGWRYMQRLQKWNQHFEIYKI